MSEIFAGRNFRESAHSRNFLHFAGIYFRELKGNFFSRELIFAKWAVWKISRELIFANWEEKFLNLCIFFNSTCHKSHKIHFREAENIFRGNLISRIERKIFFAGIKFRDLRENSRKSRNFLPAKISDIKVSLIPNLKVRS